MKRLHPFQARPSLAAEVEGLPLVVQENARARRISIRLCAATRCVRLTLPPGASRVRAAAFLDEQRPWIRSQAALRLPAPIPFAPGAVIPFQDGILKLATGTGRTATREGDRLLVPGTGELFAGRVRRWLQAEALRLLEPETRALAARLGMPVQSVGTGDYRSRWGSCAQGPNGARIAYSWRLVLAPTHVRRAVVAHEVAHLAQPDHGPDFWCLATELLGEPHAAARKWLRDHGPDLHGAGAG